MLGWPRINGRHILCWGNILKRASRRLRGGASLRSLLRLCGEKEKEQGVSGVSGVSAGCEAGEGDSGAEAEGTAAVPVDS